MKNGILLICLFTAFAAKSQDFEKLRQEQRAKDSLAQIGEASLFDPAHPDLYLTEFIGYDYNKVMPKLQMYIQDKMGMASVDAMFGMYNGWLRVAFTPQVDDAKEQRFLYLLAKMKGNSSNISQMKITGDWDLIVPLFCDYWPTTLNFNNLKKGQIVSEYYMSERITLSSNVSSNQCEVTISRNHM